MRELKYLPPFFFYFPSVFLFVASVHHILDTLKRKKESFSKFVNCTARQLSVHSAWITQQLLVSYYSRNLSPFVNGDPKL